MTQVSWRTFKTRFASTVREEFGVFRLGERAGEGGIVLLDRLHCGDDRFGPIHVEIFDFSPEQLADLTSIVWLFRGQSERFVALVEQHLDNAVLEAGLALKPTEDLTAGLEEAREEIAPFFKGNDFDAFVEFDKAVVVSREDASTFAKAVRQTKKTWAASKRDNEALKTSAGKIGELAERSRDLARQIDHVSKLFARLVDTAESELNAHNDEKWQWGRSGVFCIGISGLGECGARDIGAGAGDGQAISACDPRRYIGDTGWFGEGERSARQRGSP